MEPIPQKNPRKNLPWTLRTGKGDTCPVTWEMIETELDRLSPEEDDSFLVLKQKDGEDYWYIQSTVAVAGPHTGQYIVGCGWSGAKETAGGVALVEWYGGYGEAVELFRNVWENHMVDFTGFEDLSHELPANQREELLKITRLEVGMLGTNCYLLTEQKAKLCAVIDPGADPDRIIEEIKKQDVTVKYILLTHGHYDHVDALPELAAAFPEAEIYIHRKDVEDADRHLFHVAGMLEDPKCPVTKINYFKAFNDRNIPTSEAEQLPLGGLHIHPIHTPGHSEGSVTLRISGGPLFCGDTLFEGSCGRTDFPGGNVKKMMASLRFFGMMNGDAAVYPGHMSPTTLDAERKYNPFPPTGDAGDAMKLEFNGHNERYTVEQSLLNLFPGELPVYEPIQPGDENWAVVSWQEEKEGPEKRGHATVELSWQGKAVPYSRAIPLEGGPYQQEGQRRYAIGSCFFQAYQALTGNTPAWGMLTGVRPDKLITQALTEGKTPQEAQALLEKDYFVTPRRAALALETGTIAFRAAQDLAPRDIAVYIGVPFCPTRCAYCSFVSQSVEKSFKLVPPYVDALGSELASGGKMVQEHGFRVRAMYMGGGTPTTLSAEQLDRVLTAYETAFGPALDGCQEITVEAGRPETITAEKLAVLKAHGVTRLSVNPQTMEDHVLQAIGRRHSAQDIREALERLSPFGFPYVNMDLIAGLPEDTPEGFRRSLDACISFGVNNLTVHTLALKKGSRILLEGLRIPGPAAVTEMLDYAEPALRNAGYAPYYLYRQKYMSGSFENIGWTRPGGVSLYNIYIMSELCSILSFGAGGSTKMVDAPKRRIQRVFNHKYPQEYVDRPEKTQANLAAFALFYEN